MTPPQCRAARALLDWSQKTLAGHASVSESTIQHFERDGRGIIAANMRALREAFENHGIEFIPDGVRLIRKD